jgi:hypothetical protein
MTNQDEKSPMDMLEELAKKLGAGPFSNVKPKDEEILTEGFVKEKK